MDIEHYFKPFILQEFQDSVDKFISLLDTNAPESSIQSFLQKHAYFLTTISEIFDSFICISQPRLGSEYVADFALYGSCNLSWWTFIELESPGDQLFNKRGDPSSKLVHACRQIEDWYSWISVNPHYYDENYPDHLWGGLSKVRTGIIIGRRKDLTPQYSRRLSQMDEERRGWILTYDAIVEGLKTLNRIKEGSIVQKVAIPYTSFATAIKEHGFENLVRVTASAIHDAEFDR